MDLYVLVNLLIQCAIAVVTWITTLLPNSAAQTLNAVAAGLLLALLLLSTVWLLVVPTVRERATKRSDWPKGLGREVPEIRYYPFEVFKNVFPPWQPGTKNPVALPPKTYPPAPAGDSPLAA
jgi:hypothetical protein